MKISRSAGKCFSINHGNSCKSWAVQTDFFSSLSLEYVEFQSSWDSCPKEFNVNAVYFFKIADRVAVRIKSKILGN